MYNPIVTTALIRHQEMLKDAEQWRLINRLRDANPQPSALRQTLNAIGQLAQAWAAQLQANAAPAPVKQSQIEMDSGVFHIS